MQLSSNLHRTHTLEQCSLKPAHIDQIHSLRQLNPDQNFNIPFIDNFYDEAFETDCRLIKHFCILVYQTQEGPAKRWFFIFCTSVRKSVTTLISFILHCQYTLDPQDFKDSESPKKIPHTGDKESLNRCG